MLSNSRRRFLADVGRGMLVGSLGTAVASDLGLAELRATEEARLNFGDLEPLVALMQETPLKKLQRTLVDRINSGTQLQTLIAAGTLANARTFGGHDYVGYHTFMALAPALDMAARLPDALKPLPVLKVLYRNTERIQQFGGSPSERLRPIPRSQYDGPANGAALQDATRAANKEKADQIMAAMSSEPAGEMFNHVQYAVQDSVNVHRVVLTWRAWLAIDLVGTEHAQSLLRQSVRFCCDSSQNRIKKRRPDPELWTLTPRLLDEYSLLSNETGSRKLDDQALEDLAWTVFSSNPTQAADAVAQALADGIEPDTIGEALSVASNMLLLHDPGRKKAANGDKSIGSVHGDSVGVHASDAANAWRNIAAVSSDRNQKVSLIVGAYHTAGRMGSVGREPWPLKLDETEKATDRAVLLEMAARAVREKDQALAGAAVQRFGNQGGDPSEVFNLMLRFATSEDGALHAEKYYRTVTEEFSKTRPSLRWRQLVALARVSASEYGTRSPGYREACELVGASV